MALIRAWLGITLGLSASIAFVACGSSDNKKHLQRPEGGAAGQASSEGGSGAALVGGAPAEQGGAGPHGNAGEPSASAGDTGLGGDTSGAEAGAPQGGVGQGGAGSGDSGYTIAAYVSPTGSDMTGTGTLDNPFETLTPAAAVAQSGEAIVLMDGSHIVDYYVTLADGVALVAQNPGQATLGQMSGFNGGIGLDGSATIDGINLGYAVSLLRATTGTLNVINSTFGAHADGSGNDASILATDTAHVVLKAPAADFHWFHEPSGGRVVQLSDSATLDVEGGIFDDCAAQGSLFLVYSGATQVKLTDVTVANCPVANVLVLGNGGIALNSSVATLDGVKIQNSGTSSGIYAGFGTPEIYITDSSIDTAGGNGLFIEGAGYAGASTQKVRIETSTITGNNIGIYSYYYSKLDLGLLDVDVVENTIGIQLKFTDTTVGNTLDITGGSISNNTSYGFDATNETNKPIQLKMRGTSVTGNGNHGMYLGGNAGSMYDLGTEVDAGGNVFSNPGSGSYAGILVNAPTLVKAVGNTWIANQQGADSGGKYVPQSGSYIEVVGPVSAGNNYRIAAGAQTLWL